VPAISGSYSTSSDTCVGRAARVRIRCLRSMSAARASLDLPRPTWGGSPRVALFNGENMPLAAGSIRAACWRRPNADLNRFSWTCLFLSIVVISSAIAVALASDSLTVLSAPFNMNPRISFSTSNRASPFSSFFLEIGSLPPTCPDTSGGGNIE
jgi:hypothetical protein